ncbi:hypothetical protein Ctob_008937 [Chrysochromulina tobinii]|uniref:Uncharacterized protein n=1 Tax=Chrysochromulina tobinii TaxID=1460289 RepID=A0A0M0JDP5_9EUKA|nr:hypothetical protein Ctob_008937 [Chrysochromulina tobinii]|eukprot:KOO24701.1 hypothetical protein Ctob_008937 [Chrysochromulina sp. CCMP291]
MLLTHRVRLTPGLQPPEAAEDGDHERGKDEACGPVVPVRQEQHHAVHGEVHEEEEPLPRPNDELPLRAERPPPRAHRRRVCVGRRRRRRPSGALELRLLSPTRARPCPPCLSAHIGRSCRCVL